MAQTKEANLSRAIHWLGVSYSVWFNHRHQRSGHLFQGRFKSFLIEDDHYFAAMCLYIHGNPLRAGIVEKLADYPWSSYRDYANRGHHNSWLSRDLVLGMYGGSRRKFVREQRSFLEKNGKLLKDLRHGLYLGSDDFAERCLERAEKEKHREKPQLRSFLKGQDLRARALEILERIGEKEPDSVLTVRRSRSHLRDVAIYVLYQGGIYRNEDIGKVFGVGYTAISEAAKRGQGYLKSNKQLGRIVQGILNKE